MATKIWHKKMEDCTEFVAGDGTHLREILHPKNGDIKLPFSMAFAKIAPGAASVWHTLEQDELYIITSGSGRAEIGNAQLDLQQGDHFLAPKDIRQRVVNTGATTLEFYCLCTPPWTAAGEVLL